MTELTRIPSRLSTNRKDFSDQDVSPYLTFLFLNCFFSYGVPLSTTVSLKFKCLEIILGERCLEYK